MTGEAEQQLRAYVEYLRDLGVYDLYRRGEPVFEEVESEQPITVTPAVAPVPERETVPPVQVSVPTAPSMRTISQPAQPTPVTPLTLRASSEPEIPKLIS